MSELAAYLADKDIACPACRYNLRGLTTDQCPECRQTLVLSVAQAEPPVVQFVLAVMGLAACGVAFGIGFLMVIVISMTVGTPPRDTAVLFLFAPPVISLLDGFFVMRLVSDRGRCWFRTRSRSRRWAIVVGFWGVSLAVAGVWLGFLLQMR